MSKASNVMKQTTEYIYTGILASVNDKRVRFMFLNFDLQAGDLSIFRSC